MVGYLMSTIGTDSIQAKQWILRKILNMTMLVCVETEFTGVFAMSELCQNVLSWIILSSSVTSMNFYIENDFLKCSLQ